MNYEKIDIAHYIQEFSNHAVANISDNLDRAVGAMGILPYHKNGVMAGRAFTVKTAPGDNEFIYKALDQIAPGDVIVVDGGGYMNRALIGEVMSSIARSRGSAGIVIYGAIRDCADIYTQDFPVYAKGVCHLGPYKNGPGELNIPVNIGGMIVNPGDIIVGDTDGIVAIRPEIAAKLLADTEAQKQKETEILASIKAGTYQDAYAKYN